MCACVSSATLNKNNINTTVAYTHSQSTHIFFSLAHCILNCLYMLRCTNHFYIDTHPTHKNVKILICVWMNFSIYIMHFCWCTMHNALCYPFVPYKSLNFFCAFSVYFLPLFTIITTSHSCQFLLSRTKVNFV